MSPPPPAARSVPSTTTITVPSVTALDEPSSSAFAEQQTLDDSIPSGPVTSPFLFSKKLRLESFINILQTLIMKISSIAVS